MTNTDVESKYYLKTVHAEIDLFDRKLAHLLKFDVFEDDAARDAAARKINLKRTPLVETAKNLAKKGVEFKDSELPRSMRAATDPMAVPVEAPAAELTWH